LEHGHIRTEISGTGKNPEQEKQLITWGTFVNNMKKQPENEKSLAPGTRGQTKRSILFSSSGRLDTCGNWHHFLSAGCRVSSGPNPSTSLDKDIYSIATIIANRPEPVKLSGLGLYGPGLSSPWLVRPRLHSPALHV
jgi:hypothetical protein